jgi:hypothetical protein
MKRLSWVLLVAWLSVLPGGCGGGPADSEPPPGVRKNEQRRPAGPQQGGKSGLLAPANGKPGKP